MASNTILTRPHAGQSITAPVGPDARLEFSFDQNEAVLAKEGENLVLTFNDGGKLVLEGFYDNFGDNAQPPTLIVQGHELDGQDFLAAYDNPDLMPAAGDASVSVTGRGTYEDAMLHGVDGVDKLEKLPFDGHGAAHETSTIYESPNYHTTQESQSAASPAAASAAAPAGPHAGPPAEPPAGPPPVIPGAYQIGSSGSEDGGAGNPPPIIGEAGKQNILIGDIDTPLNVPKLNLVIAIDVGSSDGMTRGAGGQLDMVKQAVSAYLGQLKDYPNDFSVEVLLIHSGKGTSEWMDLGSRLLRTATDGIDTYTTDLSGVLTAVGKVTMDPANQVGQADFTGAFTKAGSFFDAYNNPGHEGYYWKGGQTAPLQTTGPLDTWVPTDASEYVNKMVIISASNSLGSANPSVLAGNAYNPVEVDAIAVGNNASTLGGLTAGGGTVADLGGENGQSLQDLITTTLNQQLTPVDLYHAGSDVLAGSDQNDVLFGDVLNTAALDQLAHDHGLASGLSAAALFQELQDQGLMTQDQIVDYVHQHAADFAVENPGVVSGGNDLLVGGHGNDQIFGQYGNDVLIAGDIHLTDAAANAVPGVAHDYAASDVSQFLTDLAQTPDSLGQYLAAHPEYVGQGTAADGNNYLDGGSGDDVLIGGGGTDTLIGGAGNDVIFTGGGNNNLVDGGDGNDTIYVGGGNNNLVHGGAGDDVIHVGGGDHNTIYGDAGNDTIFAGSGQNNVIYGGTGNDVMHADTGSGTATFAWNKADFDGSTDQVTNFKVGADHLSFGDLFDNSAPNESAIQALLAGRSDGQQMTVAADTTTNSITLTIHEGATVQQTVEVSFADAPAGHDFVQSVADAATSGNEEAQAQHLMTLITNVSS